MQIYVHYLATDSNHSSQRLTIQKQIYFYVLLHILLGNFVNNPMFSSNSYNLNRIRLFYEVIMKLQWRTPHSALSLKGRGSTDPDIIDAAAAKNEIIDRSIWIVMG